MHGGGVFDGAQRQRARATATFKEESSACSRQCSRQIRGAEARVMRTAARYRRQAAFVEVFLLSERQKYVFFQLRHSSTRENSRLVICSLRRYAVQLARRRGMV